MGNFGERVKKLEERFAEAEAERAVQRLVLVNLVGALLPNDSDRTALSDSLREDLAGRLQGAALLQACAQLDQLLMVGQGDLRDS